MDCEWMRDALCRADAPPRYFPATGVGVAIAKRTCARCLVSMACLEYALVNRIDHGVWGGCSERERRRLRKHHPTPPHMETLITDVRLEHSQPRTR